MVEVVVGALVRDGRVVLGHRPPDKHAYPDVWDLPGGGVEAGETERVALERELSEELGVRIALTSTSALCRVSVSSPEGPVLLSACLVREWEGTPVNAAPEEHTAIGWFGPDDLPPLVHPDVRAAVISALQDVEA